MSAFEFVCQRSRELGFDPDDIRGRHRYRSLVRARRVIAAELQDAPWDMSYPEIGRAMNRHHSTIISLLKGGKGK